MLALFSKDGEIPDEILQVPSIVSEDGLLPLALIPMTEDEQVSQVQYERLLLVVVV